MFEKNRKMVRNKIIGDAKQMSKNETEKSINLLKKLAYICLVLIVSCSQWKKQKYPKVIYYKNPILWSKGGNCSLGFFLIERSLM